RHNIGLMLQLRKQQLDSCTRGAELQFEKAVMAHLRENHASDVSGLPDDTLHKRVRFGIARARTYGLTFQNNLTAFVAHMFEIAPDCDEQPAIHAVLCDEAAQPDTRMDLLLERVPGRDWLDASRRGNPKLWQKAHV